MGAGAVRVPLHLRIPVVVTNDDEAVLKYRVYEGTGFNRDECFEFCMAEWLRSDKTDRFDKEFYDLRVSHISAFIPS